VLVADGRTVFNGDPTAVSSFFSGVLNYVTPHSAFDVAEFLIDVVSGNFCFCPHFYYCSQSVLCN
jgi:hypothetical protein